jgi:hypothetical protein
MRISLGNAALGVATLSQGSKDRVLCRFYTWRGLRFAAVKLGPSGKMHVIPGVGGIIATYIQVQVLARQSALRMD